MGLDADEKLLAAVQDFFRREFWEQLMGDEIESVEVVCELLDTAMNELHGETCRTD